MEHACRAACSHPAWWTRRSSYAPPRAPACGRLAPGSAHVLSVGVHDSQPFDLVEAFCRARRVTWQGCGVLLDTVLARLVTANGGAGATVSASWDRVCLTGDADDADGGGGGSGGGGGGGGGGGSSSGIRISISISSVPRVLYF